MPQEIQKTIPKAFLNTVKKQPDATAMRQKLFGVWQSFSWQSYYEQARCIGLALWSMGLAKGDKVAIIGENCPEWVFVDLGVQCAGGVSVGIYTTNSAKQCHYIVEHSQSKFFFVENEEQLDKWLAIREQYSKNLQKIIVWDTTGLRDFKDEMVITLADLIAIGEKVLAEHSDQFEKLAAAVQPDDLAVLIYTSGTTGQPKGAMLTHRNATWVARAAIQTNPVPETTEAMSFLPLCHVFERLFSVFLHVYRGYVLNFVESLDTISQNMREISPTVGYAVPRIWEKYHSQILIRMADATWLKRKLFHWALAVGGKRADYLIEKNVSPPFALTTAYQLAQLLVFRKLKERLGFDRMDYAYSGAAPISPDVLRFFQSIGLNLLEGYGMTETSGLISGNRSGKFKLGTVGQAIPGMEIKIAEDGEILVKSPCIFTGYFQDEENTAKALQNGWLHTGDIGEIDADGYLKIIDRKKDLIITAGGKNIAPQHIENLLKISPYINDAIVIGDRRKFLSALIVLDEDNITKYARDHKIQFAAYADLANNAEINTLIDEEVKKMNKRLARVESIRKFKILPKKLYEEDGDVTPTMKVKRSSIQKTYQDLIEKIYR